MLSNIKVINIDKYLLIFIPVFLHTLCITLAKPCNTPHPINNQDAPCHNPLIKNVIIKLIDIIINKWILLERRDFSCTQKKYPPDEGAPNKGPLSEGI